jgi:hypothetical protein
VTYEQFHNISDEAKAFIDMDHQVMPYYGWHANPYVLVVGLLFLLFTVLFQFWYLSHLGLNPAPSGSEPNLAIVNHHTLEINMSVRTKEFSMELATLIKRNCAEYFKTPVQHKYFHGPELILNQFQASYYFKNNSKCPRYLFTLHPIYC